MNTKLFFIFYLFNINLVVANVDIEAIEVKTYWINDSAQLEFGYYSNNKIAFISKKILKEDSLLPVGLKYNFSKSGRLQSLSYYYLGMLSPFRIEFNDKGKCYYINGPVDDADLLKIIDANVQIMKSSDHNSDIYSTQIGSQVIQLKYDRANGNLYSISETAWIGDNQFSKNGFSIFFYKNQLSNIKHFKNNIQVGEALYFKKNGKLRMFTFTHPDSLEKGLKIKDLNDIKSIL